ETFIWQDPVPAVTHPLITHEEAERLEAKILETGVSVPALVRTAWASASTFRGSDMRGGANGARIRLAPQKDWAVNDPAELAEVLASLEAVRGDFNKTLPGGKQVSLADTIVVAGNAAVEAAARAAGHEIDLPFTPGRTDATQEQTDVASFAMLEPTADAFRNYYDTRSYASPTRMLVEKADLLNLTVPEMTVLLGGMRALGANAGNTARGVLTDKPGVLSNDFFVNLLGMETVWEKSRETAGMYDGRERATGKHKWLASAVDLVFGSNSELRAVASAYAAAGSDAKFVEDFAAAWTKVMNLDRFDAAPSRGTSVAVR
ncbi:MAG: peroxidase family protein, partial [Gammaproteobacteria bacterium]